MPERPLVVVADPIDPGAVAALAQGPCRVIDATSGEARLDASLGEAWALIVRSRTKVTASLIARAPKLQIVARAGVGVDNVDLAAAAARKIRVVNSPTAATTSVAELTVAFLLMLARDLYPQVEETKDGGWKRGVNRTELAGKTVGFVGYGRIARRVAQLLEPFEVVALAYDPFVDRSPDRTRLLPLPELLGQSDFVSLHAASTGENRHLFDRARFAQMKRGAYLLNVARGSLVNEAALLEALDAGQLAGAALDVFENEPPKDSRLLAHPKVVVTPHIGASTHEAQQRAGQQVVEEVLRALEGKPLVAEVRAGAGP